LSDNFYREPAPKLSQGDILIAPHLHVNSMVAVADQGSIEITAIGRAVPALILNFDCEIDKPWSKRFVVCPIIPLEDLPKDQRTNAKRNRTAHLFFMPRYREILQDSVAVLNQQTTIDRALLDPSKRLVTLDVQGRLALYAQFVRWLSRWELTELTCPRCGADFDPTLALPVRQPDEP
jgi:hypothetical protein